MYTQCVYILTYVSDKSVHKRCKLLGHPHEQHAIV